MKIAILSDIHDHDQELARTLERVRETGAEELIFLGDLCAPSMIDLLMRGFPTGRVHFVFGNNDGDIQHITMKAAEHPRLQIYGEIGEIELGGTRIVFMHKPTVAHALARSGMYDLVLHGHTHIQHAEIIGQALVANPGAIRPPLTPEHDMSFAVYDTAKPRLIEFINL